MKVPEYIKQKMRYAYLYSLRSNRYMSEIEEWLYKNGINPDNLRQGNGVGLDEIEYAACTSAVDDVIKLLEEEF